MIGFSFKKMKCVYIVVYNVYVLLYYYYFILGFMCAHFFLKEVNTLFCNDALQFFSIANTL